MSSFTPMNKISYSFLVILLFVGLHASTTHAQGLDRVRLRNGVETGRITKTTPLGLTLTRSGVDRSVPVEEITSVTFAGEPNELSPARRDVGAGRYSNALDKLGSIDLTKVDRDEITQDIEFLTLYCQAQLAMAGQGSLNEVTSRASSYLSSNSKCYRVPDTIELIGDLLLASQDFAGARDQYTKLGKAPAPYFKARSALLTGRALQEEGKHSEAVAQFDEAIAAASGNAAAETQQLTATLYRAVSRAATGDVATATDTISQTIKQADPADAKLMAQAYNALGDCYRQAKQPKAAVQAFLHVDLLFASSAAEHAKALHALGQLWEELGRSDRAREANQRLQDEYPGNRWSNQS